MLEDFDSLQLLVSTATERGISLGELALELQSQEMKRTTSDLFLQMSNNLDVMRASITKGLMETSSPSGLSGGIANKVLTHDSGLVGDTGHLAQSYAIAIAEHNACMGRIVASPTAGSCGILPATLLASQKTHGFSDDAIVTALFNAGIVGMVIAKLSSLSGAQGGCAAECGSASAMAASALVELMGGTPSQCADACALTIKATMGLVCDPVAGLVEVPCVKRNASGAILALSSAELALAGVKSAIPVDEVICAMKNVGCMMHSSLKETSLGGLAVTPTALKIEQDLKRNN